MAHPAMAHREQFSRTIYHRIHLRTIQLIHLLTKICREHFERRIFELPPWLPTDTRKDSGAPSLQTRIGRSLPRGYGWR